MSGFTPIAIVWIAASAIMVCGWLYQRRTRNAGIVDALWSACMGASAVFYALTGSGAVLPRVLVGAMGAIWGLRLAAYIWHRVLHESEDGRYVALRARWDDNQGKFLIFFLAQALFTAIFSLPFWIAAHNPVAEWTVWSILALLIWFIALVGESMADRQLAKFRADPSNKGKTCRQGLWRTSRHPNYFFEWLHWFAYVALSVGTGAGWVVASLIGPTLMLCTLYWVTGIPYTEKQALRSRGDDYREYQRTTSPLIPWFPRGSDS